MDNTILITVSFLLILGTANGGVVLTNEMENIFAMLEGKTRGSRLSITTNNIKSPVVTPPRKTRADLSIKADRHGSSNINKEKQVRERWQKSDLTFKLHGHPSTMSQLETRRVFYRAFRLWSQHTQLNFHEVDDVRADINIRFASGHHGDGDGNAFDGPKGHLAHALPPPSGEVHFDAEDFWSKRSFSRRHVIVTSGGKRKLEIRSYFSLLLAATHEIGHALGLRHNLDERSIMYPLYARKTGSGRLKLHAKDIEAIQALYGRRIFSNNSLQEPTPEFMRIRRRKKTKPPPDPCTSSVDAAFSDGDTVHFFKDRYYWSWNSRTKEFSQPRKFKKRFGLSKPRVDAACYSSFSGRTYIFSGHKYWRYHGEVLETGYPRLSSNHGLPSKPSAAFHIPDTENIVVFKRKKVYIFDEVSERVKERHNISETLHSIDENAKNPLHSAVEFNNTVHFFKQAQIFSVPTNHIATRFSNSPIYAHSSSTSPRSNIPWLKHCALL